MWKFEQSQAAAMNGIIGMVHDGRDIWAFSQKTINVYSYIDEEYLTHEFQFDNGLFELKLVATIDVINYQTVSHVVCMVAHNGYMYAQTDNGYLYKYDITTKQLDPNIATIPVSVQPVMAVANNKLWFVSAEGDTSTTPLGIPTSDCQMLYYYDLINQSWSSPVLIPGKKQYITRSLVDGLDGHLYVSNLNDHAILKFTTNGVYVGQYRINRHPYLLQSNQYQQVYVVSDGQSDPLKGMVSVFDTSTNTTTNYAAAGGTISYMADVTPTIVGDPLDAAALRASALTSGKLVYIGGTPKIALVNKSDKKIKTASQDPASDDYVPGAAIQFDAAPLHGLVTPPLSFEVWNGSTFVTKTVKPYAFMATASFLYAVRLSSLVCVNSMEVLGTAMIATGAQNYYGDL